MLLLCAGGLWMLVASGCGTTKQSTAKEQLLQSNAVDTAVARLDFTPLRGQRVYFDKQYIKDYKGIGFVNADYVISSLRQQMLAAGLYLMEEKGDADFVLEARMGALGNDNYEMVYGIPQSNSIGAATTAMAAVTQVPPIPGIPELSIARRNDHFSAAKLAVFAYERESQARVWQSGVSVGRATAKDLWFLGIGPFHRGSIYEGDLYFADDTMDPTLGKDREGHNGPIAGYRKEAIFPRLDDVDRTQLAGQEEESGVKPASATTETVTPDHD